MQASRRRMSIRVYNPTFSMKGVVFPVNFVLPWFAFPVMWNLFMGMILMTFNRQRWGWRLGHSTGLCSGGRGFHSFRSL